METFDWEIERIFADGGREKLVDRVVEESPLRITVNGAPLVALMRLPGRDRELAVGFCVTEGVISSVDDIVLLRECRDGEWEETGPEGAAVKDVPGSGLVEIRVSGDADTGRFAATRLVRTGCGGADLTALAGSPVGKVDSRATFPAALLHRLGEELTRRQEVFRSTGGTHGAAVFSGEGALLEMAEDVGRHNAVDKVVGACVLRRVKAEDKVLFISGRISYEMALKAVRAGFPCLTSLAAPTRLGLEVARDSGLTVVGFADGRRCNVYTHGWRLGS